MSSQNTKTRKQRNKRTNKPKATLVETVTFPNGQREHLQGSVTGRTLPPRKGKKKVYGPANKPAGWIDPDSYQSLPQRPRRPPRARSDKPSSLSSFYLPASNDAPRTEEGTYISSESVPLVDAYVAASGYVAALLNPFSTPAARLPEIGNNTPTEAYKSIIQTLDLTISDASVGGSDGSVAFALQGDSYQTILIPSAIASTTHAVTWTDSGTYNVHTYDSYTSDFWTRPVCMSARLTVYPVGDEHTITVSSHRIPPGTQAGVIYAASTKLTAFTNIGCTAFQKAYLDGVDRNMRATGAKVQFVTSRSNSHANATAWTAVGGGRSTNRQEGWCVWVHGLRAEDRVQLEFLGHHEMISTSNPPLHPDSVAMPETTATSADAATGFMDRYVNAESDRRFGGKSWFPPTWAQYWNSVVNGDAVHLALQGLRAATVIAGLYYGGGYALIDGQHTKLHPAYYGRTSVPIPEEKDGSNNDDFPSLTGSDPTAANAVKSGALPTPRVGRLSVPVVERGK